MNAPVACLIDEQTRDHLNHQGRNCWDIYLREICSQMGATADAVTCHDLEQAEQLDDRQVLLAGAQAGARLSEAARDSLRQWVRAGGLLIGFGLEGLDDLFGVTPTGRLHQPEPDWTISAYFQFWPHELTRDIHPFLHIEQKLFAMSDVRLLQLDGSEELGRLFDLAGNDLGRPAITWRRVDLGAAAYFAFDLPKSVWQLHQGRPLPSLPPGAFALRTPQMQVLGSNSTKIAYADEMVELLQNMLAARGTPLIYPIPPDGRRVPEALLYYSGDEYTGPAEWSITASDFMAQQGLPYHINIAAHLHPMSPDQLKHIQGNGHEISCYLWIKTPDKKGSDLSREQFALQTDSLRERYGVEPGSVLVGSCQWSGWTDSARWLAEVGATADNTFIGQKGPTGDALADPKHLYGNPWYNGPFFGFGFGTSFPYFFHDDAAHGNARIDLIEQPIVGYELGHRASNILSEQDDLRDDQTLSLSDIHEAIGRAIQHHLVMNLFYHPYYIVHFEHCRRAIREITRYIEYRGSHVLHMANNEVAAWWRARDRSRVEQVERSARGVTFTAICHWPQGMIVRVPWPLTSEPMVSGALWHCQALDRGVDWLFVTVAPGRHHIQISRS
jgi:hypothetical protein